jgi:protein-L-isoaspartate O-methyltransferase
MFKKLISGGDTRSTRFHTEENILIPIGPAFIDFPKCFLTKLTARRGKRPPKPWWPTRVIPFVEDFLKKDHKVIEFGSGSSTIWLAARAKSVVSMESSAEWAKITGERLEQFDLHNCTLCLANQDQYWVPPIDSGPFDLAIIDGDFRWKCFEEIQSKMNPGGLIYLDNSDSDKDLMQYNDNGPRRRAQYLMELFAKNNTGARITKVQSLIHGEIFAGEGMLLYLP